MIRLHVYCKWANVRGGFNFAMLAVKDFSVNLKPWQSFDKCESTIRLRHNYSKCPSPLVISITNNYFSHALKK